MFIKICFSVLPVDTTIELTVLDIFKKLSGELSREEIRDTLRVLLQENIVVRHYYQNSGVSLKYSFSPDFDNLHTTYKEVLLGVK